MAFGALFVFSLPALWALSATGTVNEALGVFALRDPVTLFIGSLPMMLLGGFYGLLGGALILLLASIAVAATSSMWSLSKARRTALGSIATVAGFIGIALGAMLNERWPFALFASGVACLGVIVVYLALHATGHENRKGENLTGVGLWQHAINSFAVLGIGMMAIGLKPLPVVGFDDEGPLDGRALLVAQTGEQVWVLEPRSSESTTISAELDLVRLEGPNPVFHICRDNKLAKTAHC